MPSTTITISHARPITGILPWPTLPDDAGRAADGLSALLAGIAGGAVNAGFTVAQSANSPAAASGRVKIASGSGTITATINGVAVSVTWSSTDTATASALAAAINASTNPLISGIVRATSSAGVVTILAQAPGKTGNCITLAASGTGATASSARLTGGAGADVAVTSFSTPAAPIADFTRADTQGLLGALLLLRMI